MSEGIFGCSKRGRGEGKRKWGDEVILVLEIKSQGNC